MKRWIIRSFFILLLLLCVGGWGVTYHELLGIYFKSRNHWINAECGWGKIYLTRYDLTKYEPDIRTLLMKRPTGWHIGSRPASDITESSPRRFLGFYMKNWPACVQVIIPFWFPTLIFATLLWWVWRKTRPKSKGRAFPVELEKGNEKP